MNSYQYPGEELTLFAEAQNWKNYFSQIIRPLLGTRILEVGAGLGETTRKLIHDDQQWTCLEPDTKMADHLQTQIQQGQLPANCHVRHGDLSSLDSQTQSDYDSLLYIDVLEHIEDDMQQIQLARQRLKPGGKLIILGPAHNWLFSPFDASVGHYRRYNLATLNALCTGEQGFALQQHWYLDSLGLLLSLANRSLLRQSLPNPGQIKFWDRRIVPLSRRLDPLIHYRIGKSLLACYQRI